MRRSNIQLPAILAALFLLAVQRLPALDGFNLIGDGTTGTNTAFATGPGLAAFETVPAPQGNPGLYQRRVVVAEFQMATNGRLRSVSGAFFGSRNVNNHLTPVDLRGVPGVIVCSVWTNGLAGFAARPGAPDLEFTAGSTTDLLPAGGITNPATGTNYPLYLARADLPATPAFRLFAGGKYALGLRLGYFAVTDVTTRLATTIRTNEPAGDVLLLGGGYSGPDTGTNISTVPLAALAVEYLPSGPPKLELQPIPPDQVRLTFLGEGVTNFLRFESATNLTPPIEWLAIPAFGDPPVATNSRAGASQKFYRAVQQP